MILFKNFLTLNPKDLYTIVRYRFHQYRGSYNGNHLHKKVSSQLRDALLPNNLKGNPLTSDYFKVTDRNKHYVVALLPMKANSSRVPERISEIFVASPFIGSSILF